MNFIEESFTKYGHRFPFGRQAWLTFSDQAFYKIFGCLRSTSKLSRLILYGLPISCSVRSCLVVSVLQWTLQRCLEAANGTGLPFVDRLLLALIFHCSKDEDHSRAIRDLQSAFARTFRELDDPRH